MLKVCEEFINALKMRKGLFKKLKQQHMTRKQNRVAPKHV